jgi:hypothetical protein
VYELLQCGWSTYLGAVHRRQRRQRGKQPPTRQPQAETVKSETRTTGSTVTHDLHVEAAAKAHSDVATATAASSSNGALSKWFCYPEFGASTSAATGNAVASAKCAHIRSASSSGDADSSSVCSTCVNSGSSSATSTTAVRRVSCNRCVLAHHTCRLSNCCVLRTVTSAAHSVQSVLY